MRRLFGLFVVAAVCLIPICQTAMGHGFQLSLSGNQLTAQGDDFLGGSTTNPYTYSSAWTTVTGGSDYLKTAGGVEPSATGGLSVAGGDTFSLEFVSPLMYSNGGTATPAGSGIAMAIRSYVSTTYTLGNLIDSSSLNGTVIPSAFLNVSGNTSHSINWELTGSSIPGGVYGFAYVAHGSNGATTYGPTGPLVVLLNTGDSFSDPTSVLAARAAVYSAVPEPNSVVLAGVGAVLLLGYASRRLCFNQSRQLAGTGTI